MTLETVDPVIPISNMISRYEKIIDDTRETLATVPVWNIVKRNRLLGIITAYRFEVDVLLQLAATTQPFLRDVCVTGYAGQDRTRR